jgi:bifunctional UDP-N-acetylglucosamine pyrophosphorylase/glucosamine-1-phosphate N-acetyltransferase
VPVNAQGEYYLTDVPGILRADGEDVSVFLHHDAREVSGINTRVELADFERTMRLRTLRRLMLDSGVTIIDPAHTYVDSAAQIGRDTVLHPNTHIEGRTTVGENCEILPGARIVNSVIGNEVTIKDHSIITDSEISDRCSIGPFAHLRMNARMEEGAVIGNFVEMKKSRLGRKSKAMHLTYLGDAEIGERTNIGAGHDHLQLRRQKQTPDNHRIGCENRQRHDARRARARRRAKHHRRRFRRHERCRARHACRRGSRANEKATRHRIAR